jgi:hypothetical protein
VFTATIKPQLQSGQGVFQSELEVLLFHLVDLLTPYLKVKEVMEFPRRLMVKQNLENF